MPHITVRVLAAIEQQIQGSDAMDKSPPELRILWEAGVIEPLKCNPGGIEQRLLNVVLRHRARQIMSRTGLLTKTYQAGSSGPIAHNRIVPAIPNAGLNTDVLANRFDELTVHL